MNLFDFSVWDIIIEKWHEKRIQSSSHLDHREQLWMGEGKNEAPNPGLEPGSLGGRLGGIRTHTTRKWDEYATSYTTNRKSENITNCTNRELVTYSSFLPINTCITGELYLMAVEVMVKFWKMTEKSKVKSQESSGINYSSRVIWFKSFCVSILNSLE